MAMNREQKRAMQKQGMATEDGSPSSPKNRRAPAPKTKEERSNPRQYFREVVAELRKTSWPTRAETLRLGFIVFVAIVVLTLFIFGLDVLFSEAMTRLFNTSESPQSALGAAALLIAPRLTR